MENAIEVESAEVAMDISLEDGLTRNGKSPNKNFLLEQNHQPVCTTYNERVGLYIIYCSECHLKFIINARFYLHISYITLLRGKERIHAQIAHLPMFPI